MHDPHHASVLLVLGGVRSGKSRYAQGIAEASRRVTMIATAQAGDNEMRRKIARHQADRPAHWATIEEPLALGRALQVAQGKCDAVLVDCLTLFTANLLHTYGEDDARLQEEIDSLCGALWSPACKVILVSNEVGSGVVPAYALGRRFRDLAGEINQRVAAIANTVVLLVAGLPLPLKGSLLGLSAGGQA